MKNEKIFCANCANCKVVRSYMLGDGKQYQLRVKCDKGHWRKKLGEEKLYKYFTLPRRIVETCPDYTSTGDEKSFMKELKETLPIKDEVYRTP